MKKDGEISPSFFMAVVFILLIFFKFKITVRKTKQIIVALITTAINPLLSVAKAHVGLSRRNHYAADIYFLS